MTIAVSDDHCHLCGKHYEVRCKCLLGERRCPEGHSWYFCPVHPDRRIEGPADHSLATDRCRCPQEKQP